MTRNAVHALFDEWDRARRELVALLPRIPTTELEAGDPLDQTRARGILIHVLRSEFGYAMWICDCLGFPQPQRREDPKTLSSREDFQRGFEDLRAFFERALEPLTDHHLNGPGPGQPPAHFKSRWGEDYGIEQMLEHAICHYLRHRRQLERMGLADGWNRA
jgi:DinB superfamily